jgi:hypothetical protein
MIKVGDDITTITTNEDGKVKDVLDNVLIFNGKAVRNPEKNARHLARVNHHFTLEGAVLVDQKKNTYSKTPGFIVTINGKDEVYGVQELKTSIKVPLSPEQLESMQNAVENQYNPENASAFGGKKIKRTKRTKRTKRRAQRTRRARNCRGAKMRGGIKAPLLEQFGSERTRFNVTCMNGEQYTSPYVYAGALLASRAARTYCAYKGGISRVSYDMNANVHDDLY